MTNQEIFNKVTAHLLKQGAKSLTADGGGCCYHAADGKMCAIGVLIKDEYYHKDLEGANIYDYGVQAALRHSGISMEGRLSFLGRLQAIHDSMSPKAWEAELKAFASNHQLTFPKEQA